MELQSLEEDLKDIRLEDIGVMMHPRSPYIMMDFVRYLENSKLYNFPEELGSMALKDFLHHVSKTSKDISDLFDEADIHTKYISAIKDLDEAGNIEPDLAIKIIDYWWMANILKQRHSDILEYDALRNKSKSYYSSLIDESSKKYFVEKLGRDFFS